MFSVLSVYNYFSNTFNQIKTTQQREGNKSHFYRTMLCIARLLPSPGVRA